MSASIIGTKTSSEYVMAVIRVLQGPNPGHLYSIEGTSEILGRHPACDIVLESASVSRQHARILTADGKFYLEDLRSRNGTFLNGQPITQRQLLNDKDEIGICDLLFSFHTTTPEPNSISPARRDDMATAVLMVDEDNQRVSSGSKVVSKLKVTSSSDGLRLEINTEAKLKALLAVSQNLGKALGLTDVLTKLLDSLFTIFPQADRAFIVLRDPKTGRIAPKAAKHRRKESTRPIRISRTIVDNVMAGKQAVLSDDAAADVRFDMSQSVVDFQIRSMICAPLVDREGNAFGVIQLDTLDPTNRFRQDDLDVLVSVACQAVFAVENAQLHELAMRDQAMKRELAVAQEVQCGLLPSDAPRITGYEFYDFYEPASQLGGDYYDYIELPGGRLAVVVADVSGKGISASLLMAKLSAETRYCLASSPNPAQAVGRLNRAFCNSGWEDRFVTLVVVVLNPATHEVTVVNAGHPAPLLRHGPGVVEVIAEAETRLPLGVDAEIGYVPCHLSLAPGESLFLYTDGITEAMNAKDELYGAERLLTQLRTDADSVTSLSRLLLNDVKRFIGAHPQSDDMCLACFGRLKE
jgi:phosphoserine phosphatase RsbU/P